MSITIGGNILQYTTSERRYITTYMSDVTTALSTIDRLFDTLIPLYTSQDLTYSNDCGNNAETICDTLTRHVETSGKIFIRSWMPENDEVLRTMKPVYGGQSLIIGVQYHALGYVEVIIDDKPFYIAIETNIKKPYSIQFYVGNTMDELSTIIKARYQCKNFTITHDCNREWYGSSPSDKTYGGKRKSRRRKHKNKKTRRRISCICKTVHPR